MTDVDTLRPEVAQALGFMDRNQKYGDGSVCAGDIDIIRAELLRLTDENARLRDPEGEWINRGALDHWKDRAERAEAELAALKARIKGGWLCGVSNDACPGNFDAAIYCLPSRFRGKHVRLIVEE